MADRPLMIDYDSCAYAFGADMLQKQDLEDSIKRMIIGNRSKHIAPAEKSY